MKKQILFLAFFTLALIFAGTKSYAQVTVPVSGSIIADGLPAAYVNYLSPSGTLECAPITPLTCYANVDALHPQAGLAYTYNVTVTAAGGRIHWFVTDQLNIVAALNDLDGTLIDPGTGLGQYVLTAGTEYNNPLQTDNTIDISWKSFNGATTPVLLVTYVVDASGCTDNIQVYRIEPVFNFTLDIAGIEEVTGATTTTPTECVSPIESAIYDAAANSGAGGLTVDYGENYLYFSVTAANFTHSWQPTFQTVYTGVLGAGATGGITVQWAYPADAISSTGTWHNTTPANNTTATVTTYTSTDPVLHPATVGAVVGADNGTGQCIVVRVRVDHGINENPQPTNQTLTLGVNGIMYDANAATALVTYTNPILADLGPDGSDADSNCDQVDYDDSQAYTLTPRPLIVSATPPNGTLLVPIQPFEQKN